MQLPDEHLQELFDDIAAKGREHARAKALVTSLTELRKITKNQLMKMMAEVHGVRGREKLEMEAYTHPQYRLVVDKLAKAIEDEVNKAVEHQNAERAWESWRTLCANERAIHR